MLSRFSRIQLFVGPWAVAHQAPLSMGILQARILEFVAMPSSTGLPNPGKNPPTMRETWVRSLGWEDHLEEGMGTHCSILA